MFFFFFQAEDGIRDLTVTGVQTCALPISPEIHGEHVVPVAARDLPHRRLDGSGDTGAVDQDIDPTSECGERALDERPHRGLVGDVRGLCERPTTERLDLAGEGLERRDLARREDQVRALAGEREADLAAHPLGRAGHDGDPVLQAPPHSTASRRSRSRASADRSAGGPEPPPPHVSISTRSPCLRVVVALPPKSRAFGPGLTVMRKGTASAAPATPHGATTPRSSMLVSA